MTSLYFTYETEQLEPNIEGDLREVATLNYLEKKILLALEKEDIDDAEMYSSLATYLHINISKEILTKIDDENTVWKKSVRHGKSFSQGFISGEAHNGVALTGAIISDMTVVGDVRDMYKEGTKMAKGDDYDKFTLGIATIGLALTASTYISLGTTAPLKIGESIIKVAKKTGRISKAFLEVLSSKLAKTVDFSLLKRVDWSSMRKMKNSAKTFFKTIDISHMKKIFNNVADISKNTSKIDSIKIMKYIDKPKDMKRALSLSKKFKKNTVAVFKILGKGALKTGKIVTKYTALFIWELVLATLSFFGFIGLFIVKYLMLKAVRRTVLAN